MYILLHMQNELNLFGVVIRFLHYFILFLLFLFLFLSSKIGNYCERRLVQIQFCRIKLK